MIIQARYYLLLLLLLLLSACSQHVQIPPSQQTTQAIPEDWQMSAKLGIRSNGDSGSVTINWQQTQSQYHIRVSGPLGQGNGKITGNTGFITIERANKPIVSSNNPEQLIYNTFGWTLPLQHLNYWVRGLPSPHLVTQRQEFENTGTLKKLEQSGWNLSYDRYKPISGWLMPGRVKAKKGDTNLTLIIKKWQFSQTASKQAVLLISVVPVP